MVCIASGYCPERHLNGFDVVGGIALNSRFFGELRPGRGLEHEKAIGILSVRVENAGCGGRDVNAGQILAWDERGDDFGHIALFWHLLPLIARFLPNGAVSVEVGQLAGADEDLGGLQREVSLGWCEDWLDAVGGWRCDRERKNEPKDYCFQEWRAFSVGCPYSVPVLMAYVLATYWEIRLAGTLGWPCLVFRVPIVSNFPRPWLREPHS